MVFPFPVTGIVRDTVEKFGVSKRFVVVSLPAAVDNITTILDTELTPFVVAGMPLHEAHIRTGDSPLLNCLIVPAVVFVDDAAKSVTEGVNEKNSAGGSAANVFNAKVKTEKMIRI